MASQPQLAEEVMPCLSTQAQAVVNGYLSASPKLAFESTHSNDLPEILVSPPWRGKKKTALLRLDLVPLELAPKARWQPGERERLAATSLPVISARDLLRNAWNEKVVELYYRS